MTSSTPSSSSSVTPSSTNSQPKGFVPAEEESFNFRQIIAIARRRAWLIMIVAVAVTAGIWARTLTQPPRYRSAFQLLVEPIAGDEEFQQLSEQLGGGGSGRGRNSGLDYGTQIQVLTSSQVMRPIYETLRQDYPGLGYGALVGGLRVGRVGETKILQVSYESENPQLAGAVTETVAQGFIDYSEKQQQTGEQRVLDLINEQLPDLRKKVEAIQNEIQNFRNENNIIDPIEKGNTLSGNITALEQSQQQTEISIEENISLRANLLEQLGLGLEEAITTVALSEAPRYQELLNQLKQIETQIALELGRFKAESPNIEVLEQQRESLLELLQEEAIAVLGEQGVSEEIRSQVTSPNPIRLSLTQELITATNQIRVLRVRLEALKQAEIELRDDLKQLTELAREYDEINQRLSIAQQNVRRFINRREQLKIQAVQTTVPWQILEPPFEPSRPISGNTRGLILGVIAGVVAGAGVAYLAEKIDNKFHTVDDVKEDTSLPIIGIIPFERELQTLGERSESSKLAGQREEENGLSNGHRQRFFPILESIFGSSFSFREAFQSLHTNLSFMNPDHPVKSLVISSSIPAEGKSTVALSLGQAAAAVGKRVLLVDADLRLPKLHQLLELPNQYGLSNVLSSGINHEEAIQPSNLSDNLYILTSGPTPPDPTRLLSSRTMKQLTQEWEDAFDLVLFDTPPLGGLADARILAPLTNGLVLVIGLGVVERFMYKDVIDVLNISKTKVLGVVANGLVQGSIGDYYYYYSYYYGGPGSRMSDTSQTSLNAGSE